MAYMVTTTNRFATRMLNFHRFIKTNIVAGLLSRRRHHHAPPSTGEPRSPPPQIVHVLDGKKAIVVDVDRLLLNPSSSPASSSAAAAAALFPPFFLFAVEAGGFIRGLVLLLLYPLLCLMTEGIRLKAIVMVCFLGLRRRDAARAGRVVLPKYFLRDAAEDTSAALMAAAASANDGEVTVAALTRSFPTVMVETFLKEYIGFDAVIGREVKSTLRGGHFAGVMVNDDDVSDVVSEAPKKKNAGTTPPRPLIFHDGRLAFTPTPSAALAMYAYLPFAVFLSLLRISIFTLLPRTLSGAAAALTGVRLRVTGTTPPPPLAVTGGRLYASNHRTLLDAVAVSSALGRPVSTVTYSLGRLSEILSPIPLLRLTREREEDRRRMASLLTRGDDVVVCPEGTTCREPYLLRFSALFAELADEVTPVAVHAAAGMFYATSTSPTAKCFDSVFFLMNPSPGYSVSFLEPVAAAGDGGSGSIEVANRVQRVIADDLGYEATALTRKAKYLLLAGNEGVVAASQQKQN